MMRDHPYSPSHNLENRVCCGGTGESPVEAFMRGLGVKIEKKKPPAPTR